MRPWLLMAGDIWPSGGMDTANWALARYLAHRKVPVHLVAHRIWPGLLDRSGVRGCRVPRPLGANRLGAALLARAGRHVARQLAGQAVHRIANGGNVDTRDVNWVHYVHAAFEPVRAGSRLTRASHRSLHQRAVAAERDIIPACRLVVCNSQRTCRDVIERLGVPEERVRLVYYGIDADRYRLRGDVEQARARELLGWPADRPMVLFIGALGDRRKGFDLLFEAWCRLCRYPSWEGELAVAGAGAELGAWRRRARHAGLAHRFRFLGFRNDVADLLAASDVLVHPARYEAYGLAVHEALCRGLPAIVSRSAGVAERFPAELAPLLLDPIEDPRDIAYLLRHWRLNLDRYRSAVVPVAERLSAWTWREMSARFVSLVEAPSTDLPGPAPLGEKAAGLRELAPVGNR